MSPSGIPRGSEVLVTLTGDHLQDTKSLLLLSTTGVGAVIESKPSPTTNSLTLRITIAPNAPLTERALRVVTPHGISNPVRFFIGQWKSVKEAEPNNTPGNARTFDPPATLQGALHAEGDKDVYRFKATRGQHLIFEVDAARRGSKIHPALEIKSAGGKVIPSQSQRLGLDTQITFEAPADGTYDLWIQDSRGQGGEGFEYRIRVGPLPYMESILPLG